MAEFRVWLFGDQESDGVTAEALSPMLAALRGGYMIAKAENMRRAFEVCVARKFGPIVVDPALVFKVSSPSLVEGRMCGVEPYEVALEPEPEPA